MKNNYLQDYSLKFAQNNFSIIQKKFGTIYPSENGILKLVSANLSLRKARSLAKRLNNIVRFEQVCDNYPNYFFIAKFHEQNLSQVCKIIR